MEQGLNQFNTWMETIFDYTWISVFVLLALAGVIIMWSWYQRKHRKKTYDDLDELELLLDQSK